MTDEARIGHALQPDLAGTGQTGQNHTLAAEHFVLDVADADDTEIDVRRHRGQAARIDLQPLAVVRDAIEFVTKPPMLF